MGRLIINADDFGLTAGVNRAVAELHRAGVLTSATLMARAAAIASAKLAAGGAVVCNVSRAMVAEVRRLYRPSLIVLVSARPETLAARLAARGREDGASLRQRLARSAVAEVAFEPDATIDNDGALDEAVARLHDLVVGALRSAAP